MSQRRNRGTLTMDFYRRCAGLSLMQAVLLIFAATMFAASPAAAKQPCAPGAPCAVAGGYYLAAPPPGWDGVSELPLIMYFHGWNSSPEASFRNKAMLRSAHQRGALFVAPYARSGYWRQIGPGRAEAGRDEAAFIRAVLDDLGRRYPIDRNRSLATGFSRGASMVWNIACYMRGAFQAYAPIAGGFWGRTPADCPAGPVNLRHIHGVADRVVAFDVRGIYDSAPIPEGLALLAKINGCVGEPRTAPGSKRLQCLRWSRCASGKGLELCTHRGGHSIPAEWVGEGFDWMLRVAGAR
ncbi:MAG: hypothetical protein MRY74_02225 [Neomegalonema sp.]|nr:hypothetical protein [Neomegalonema sp.]